MATVASGHFGKIPQEPTVSAPRAWLLRDIIGLGHGSVRSEQASQRIFTHLVGLWLFGAFCTVPDGVKTSTTRLGFNLYLSELFAIAALLMLAGAGGRLRRSWPPLVVLAWGIVLGVVRSSDPVNLYYDVHGLICMAVAAALASAIHSTEQVVLLAKYLYTCVVVSAVLEILMIGGGLNVPGELRSSFDNPSQASVGRLITHTHMLAEMAAAILLVLLLQRFINARKFLLLFSPVAVILSLSGTRFTAAFIVIPILTAFFSRSAKGAVSVFLRATASLIALALVTSAVLQVLGFDASKFAGYFQNTWKRLQLVVEAGVSADSSLSYRQLESARAIPVMFDHLISGIGFGQPYADTPVGQFGDAWLDVHGSYWVHNNFIWLPLKVGVPFALLFLAWVVGAIAVRTISPLHQAVKSVLLALLAISFVWGTVSGWPDPIIFGLCIGLSYKLADATSRTATMIP